MHVKCSVLFLECESPYMPPVALLFYYYSETSLPPTEPFIFVNLIELGMIHPGHHSGGRLYYVIPSVTIRKLSPREQLQCLCFVCGNECPVFRVLGPTCFSCVSIRIPECPNRAVQPLQSSYRMFIEAGHGFLSRGTQFVAVIPL